MNPLYPSIRTDRYESESHVKFIHLTFLRKKHTDGIWYLVIFTKEKEFAKTLYPPLDLAYSLCDFNKEVYMFLILGIIFPDQKDSFGNMFYLVDKDQSEETERVKNFI